MNRMESNKAKGNHPGAAGPGDLEYCKRVVTEDKLRKILELPREDRDPHIEKLPSAERALLLEMESSLGSAVSSSSANGNAGSRLLQKIAHANVKHDELKRCKLVVAEDKIKHIRNLPKKSDREPLIDKLTLEERIVYVSQIVEDKRYTLPAPTIINSASNFVVVTYWWGRGNMNKNLAIPCQDKYEDFAKVAVDAYTSSETDPGDPVAFIDAFLADSPALQSGFESYFFEKDRFFKTDRSSDPLVKQEPITEAVVPEVKTIMKELFLAFHRKGHLLKRRELEDRRRVLETQSKQLAVQMKAITKEESDLRRKIAIGSTVPVASMAAAKREAFLERVKALQATLTEVTGRTAELRTQQITLARSAKDLTKEKKATDYQKELIDLFKKKRADEPSEPTYLARMENLLQYKRPISFDAMIRDQWIPKCEAVNCNYLAMEYDDIAVSGMYQVAINAKPLFIRKALEACYPRAVVYIDGDMFMNHYPRIFDIEDVDFMARGWNIDPRSSPKYQREITVDPYKFETSGGIMYYSQTPEAHMLLDKWQEYSHSERQVGRADDRILSFLFNSLRLLAPLKIIQLPIEYLWLTMAYESMKQTPETRAFNIPILNPTNIDTTKIFSEHPACLTSEDTASGEGAASDREAKGGVAFEDTEYPRAELLMESVMFPTQEMADEFRPWLTYMNKARYFQNAMKMDTDFIDYNAMELDYGNNLPKMPVAVPLPEGVEGPLDQTYVTNWSRVMGVHPFTVYPWGTYGSPRSDWIYRKNIAAISNTKDLFPSAAEGSTVELNEETFLIPHILKQLSLKRNIRYVPATTEPRHLAGIEASQAHSKNRLEFVFYDRSNYTFRQKEVLKYQYKLDLRKPMYISGTSVKGAVNPILFKMFALIKNSNRTKLIKDPDTKRFIPIEIYKAGIMNVFVDGYQFLSRIRAFEATPRVVSPLHANNEPPHVPSEIVTPQSYQGSLRSNESTPSSPVGNNWTANIPVATSASDSTANNLLLSGPLPPQGPNTFLANVDRVRATAGSEAPPEFPVLQGGGDDTIQINEKDALEFLYGSNKNTPAKNGGFRFRKTLRKANKKQTTRRARY